MDVDATVSRSFCKMEKTVKIILTCGHPDSGFQMVHAEFVAAGLPQAQPSRRESLPVDKFQANILKAYDQELAGSDVIEQILPGKIWQELAVDLFMGNMAQKAWGWADASTVWLMDFWKDFDPQIGFVLVYSAPEFAIGQALRNKHATPADIDHVIASWTAYNSEILRFYNRNQNRCVLVNALAVINAPARIIEQCANKLGIELDPAFSAYEADNSHVSAIASNLAKSLIENHTEAVALYRELESSADCDIGSAFNSKEEIYQAWREYSALLFALDQGAAVAGVQQEHIEQLTLERHAQDKLAAEQQSQIELISKVRDEQTALANERYLLIRQLTAQLEDCQTSLDSMRSSCQMQNQKVIQDNELLLFQLHGVQEELEYNMRQGAAMASAQQEHIEQLTLERHAQDKLAAELQSQIELISDVRDEQTALANERYLLIRQLTAQLEDCQTSLDSMRSSCQMQNQKVMQDNELLLLQLHEVQEELEYSMGQNQNLTYLAQSNSTPAASFVKFWHRNQPAEILIDMTQEVDGDNWYHAEHDGRWAGPGQRSTVRLPALREGDYQLRLDIVDAMEPEILAGMKVSVNGIALESTLDGEGVNAPIYAQFSTQALTQSPVWEFQFNFDKLVSPAAHGSEDQRILAIRLQSLRLSILE